MALKRGSSGPDVANLQRLLLELGIAAAPASNGTFDAATESAVKTMQRQLHVEDDGIVGKATLAAVANGQILKLGSKGPAVRALQLATGLKADGDFGRQTEARVSLIQQSAGLNPPDGQVGPQTWTAIKSGRVGATAGATRHPDARTSPATNRTAQVSGRVAITAAQATDAVDNRRNIQLSPNFDLATLVYSPTARSARVDNWPKDPVLVMRLSGLCMNMLEPLAARYGRGRMNINSGYRNRTVNRLVGSKSDNSNHTKGYAADLEINGIDNAELWQWIKTNMRYHELILEFYKRNAGPTSGWVHVAHACDLSNQGMRAFRIG